MKNAPHKNLPSQKLPLHSFNQKMGKDDLLFKFTGIGKSQVVANSDNGDSDTSSKRGRLSIIDRVKQKKNEAAEINQKETTPTSNASKNSSNINILQAMRSKNKTFAVAPSVKQ